MKRLRGGVLLTLIVGTLVSLSPGRGAGVVSAQTAGGSVGQVSSATVTFAGTTTLAAQGAENALAPGSITRGVNAHAGQVNRLIPRRPAAANAPALPVPAPASSTLAGVDAGSGGFAGLTALQQRVAGSGPYMNTQGDLEPPDQGLCTGQGIVLEAVNNAVRAYTTAGTPVSAATPLNAFFRVAPEQTTGVPPTFGPFLSDPRCYYDADTGRWFLTELEIATDPAIGTFGTTSQLVIAVSQGADPTGTWNLYTIDTTDTTGTPDHAGCPCFGDQPLIGADRYGFYISTNEFPITGPGFNGAQIYALSKAALAAGASAVGVVHLSGIPLAGNQAYTIQPATSPAAQYETAHGGTEYFLSALDFFNTGDNRIAAWALVNTSSLATATPRLRLSSSVLGSEPYGPPYPADQKAGPTPLRDFLNFSFRDNDPVAQLSSNDDRMNQVVFAAGKLWAGLNTVAQPLGSAPHVGVTYFIVAPGVTDGQVTATMVTQGYVALLRQSVLFPSIGVNAAGQGVMGFSVSGPDVYPSTAYALIDAATGVGSVHLAGVGAKPEDGFTGYHFFGGTGVARWGDYSAAVAAADGSIWLAAEYIPNSPRDYLTNWGTFISHILP